MRILSGSLHYFRIHPDHWADRLHKARLMGLNTVDVYVPWNLHEPRPGEFQDLGLPRFLELAGAEGLDVLLRPGPYICGEWEGGGLPSWLLKEPDMRLRSTDPRFLAAVDAYFAWLLPPLVPLLRDPIVAVQVENEYGAYGEDRDYLEHLVKALRDNGVDVPLFTSDQPADLKNGSLPGIMKTVNFGAGAAQKLAILREQQPDGPLMCAEFWIGWFDQWGGPHVVRDAADAAEELDVLLAAGASVNFYMFHGGTNFGFTNGANDKGTYRPTVTSYDYDAPLDEAGDPTAKFAAFREVIARYADVPAGPVPAPSAKLSAGQVYLHESASLAGALDVLSSPVASGTPMTMEQFGQAFGFVHYEAVLPVEGPVLLEFEGVRDRAQVFLDGQPVGVLERERHESTLTFHVPQAGAVLTVLVENQGRVNYGEGIHDRKGIVGAVRLNGMELRRWQNRALPLDSLARIPFTVAEATVGPAFYRGTVAVTEPTDTYLALDGWRKGNAWVNGFNLGRYWSRGPQRSLYVPGPVLQRGENELVVFELEAAPYLRTVDLRDRPDLGLTEA